MIDPKEEPPLPETEYFAYDIYAFTHDQMRSYARLYAAPLVARIAELNGWLEICGANAVKQATRIAELEAQKVREDEVIRWVTKGVEEIITERDSLRMQLAEAQREPGDSYE